MYRQCQNVFPNYAEWLNPEKMTARRFFIAKIISKSDMIVLAKLSELAGDEWPLDLLGWMFCCAGPMQQRKIIAGYKKIIRDFDNGTIKKETVGGNQRYAVADPDGILGKLRDK